MRTKKEQRLLDIKELAKNLLVHRDISNSQAIKQATKFYEKFEVFSEEYLSEDDME